jgi:hypothetical protein
MAVRYHSLCAPIWNRQNMINKSSSTGTMIRQGPWNLSPRSWKLLFLELILNQSAKPILEMSRRLSPTCNANTPKMIQCQIVIREAPTVLLSELKFVVLKTLLLLKRQTSRRLKGTQSKITTS